MDSLAVTRYKGFRIEARPYQLHESQRWTVDLEIRRNGRRQTFGVEERYSSQREADVRSAALGKRIVDGGISGWSVDHLR